MRQPARPEIRRAVTGVLQDHVGHDQGGREWRGEFCNRKKNGELYWEAASISPVRSPDGDVTHFVAVKEDITERRRVAEELRQAKESADAASQAKSEFLANMSHELRTPMNAIIGYSEMLTEDAEDAGNEEAAGDLKKIHAAGNHLLALINDVLDLSKIEAGKMDLYLESFEIPATVEEVVTTIDALVKKNDNTLRVEVDPSLGAMRGRRHQGAPGALQPAEQRRQVHPSGRDRAGGDGASGRRAWTGCGWRCRTRASGSRRRRSTTCSRSSPRPTRPRRGITAAPGWACPSADASAR